jgi:thioredoxin reductase
VARVDHRLELDLDGGRRVHARRVMLATGMQYCPPDLPGLGALWGKGKSVFQCPFCHGWELRDKRLAALASGGEAVHAALMMRGTTWWCSATGHPASTSSRVVD